MKRLIKFHNPITNNSEFSDCSTKFEVLPFLMDDSASGTDLVTIAKNLGMKTNGKTQTIKPKNKWDKLRVTHVLPLAEKVKGQGFYSDKKYNVWLGWISVKENDILKPVIKGGKMTADEAHEIINHQMFGVSDVGEHLNGKTILVKSSWSYYVEMRLLGYDEKQFEKVAGVEEDYGFDDDTHHCDECYKFMSDDSGYTSNFRVVNCSMVGVPCGCYAQYSEDPSNLGDYANSDSESIELENAKKLAEKGHLTFIERYIGGMTDPGRGGHWGGYRSNGAGEVDEDGYGHVRNGQPKEVLAALKRIDPTGRYVFSHDESGQFQTYFSVWRINDKTRASKIKAIRIDLGHTNLEQRIKK